MTIWFLVIFGLGYDASAGSIPQISQADCQVQATWINENRTGHAFCVRGLVK